MGRIWSVLGIGLMALGSASEVRAQTNEEIFEQFQWQVFTPGARSDAMGGAFAASADDPTAGLLNPAGLVAISRPRALVEFSRTKIAVDRLTTVDSLFTGRPTAIADTTNAVSFAGVALPIWDNRVVMAFSRHEPVNYRSAFRVAPRALPGLAGVARAFSPADNRAEFRAASYAASFGAALNDRLRLGLTLSVERLRVDALYRRHDIVVGSGPFDLVEIPVVTNESNIDDDDTRVGFVLGAIYQPARAVSFGVSYSRRPSFEMTEDFRLNTGRQRGNNGPFASQIGFPKTVTLNLPDQASAGVALRPHSRLLVALDGAYVRHSELARNLTPVIGFDLVTASDFKIDDVLELHLGAELNLGSDSRPLFVRAGVFSNPDHRLQYVGNVQPGAVITAAQAQRINVIERSVFNLGTGGTEVKGTIGGGLTLGRHGQVDVAYVWNRRFVVSLGGRF